MKLIILGAGGYGQTIADVAEQLGYEVSFLDDHADKVMDTLYKAIDICANFAQYIGDDTCFYPAFGNNESRVAWLEKLTEAGCNIPTIIHPTAYVSPKAKVLPGTAILPGAIVNTGCIIKSGCIINCGAVVDHGCTLEEGVHICLGAIVKAENHLPRYMKVEAGTVIGNREYK